MVLNLLTYLKPIPIIIYDQIAKKSILAAKVFIKFISELLGNTPFRVVIEADNK